MTGHSLLRYASLRGRERIVGMLLRGGSSLACWPCDGENVDMESLTQLPVQEASRSCAGRGAWSSTATRTRRAALTEAPAWRKLEEAQREAVVGRLRLRRKPARAFFAHLAVRRPYGAFVPCPACGSEVVPAPVTRARELDAGRSGSRTKRAKTSRA